MAEQAPVNGIGTLKEHELHAALKELYRQPGDQVEQKVEGSVIDIVRGDLLIEIQTRHFYAIRPKLERLLDKGYRVLLVYPVPAQKWIVRQRESGEELSRRRSPAKGGVEQVFAELVGLPGLVEHPNFSLDVLLVREEQVLVNDGRGSWRRKGWSVAERKLIGVIEKHTFQTAQDFAGLLPAVTADPFTTRDVAATLHINRRLAGKMLYCLREMGAVDLAGRKGRAYIYRRNDGRPSI